MGFRYVDECCHCATAGYPCTGEHKHIREYFCDECREEVEPNQLYNYESKDLCAECLLKKFEKVRID